MPDPERYRVAPVDAAAWDGFVAGAVGATPFSLAGFVDDAARATATEPTFLGAFDGGHLVAGVAGVVSGSGWRRRFATPDLVPHTGFLFRPAATDRAAHVESERAAAAQALVGALQSGYGRIHLTHAPAVVDTRACQWAGWNVTPRYTYTIDLGSRADDRSAVWDRFERRTRTTVRKAEKAGYRVEPAADAGELRRLYGQVYGGEAHAPVAGPVLESMAGLALAAGRAEGWRCVAPGGATAAIVVFVAGGDSLYAWVAGADPAHRDAGAAALLYWSVLRTTPCSRFDFVGANLQSIAFFKRGFGGDLVPYFATEGFGHPLLRVAVSLRRALRHR